MKKNIYEKTYSIGDAAKMTGISQRMLRAWEDKYIPEPQRIVCGDRSYRRYTQAQINLIAKIKECRDEGFTLQAAVKKAGVEISGKGVNNHA